MRGTPRGLLLGATLVGAIGVMSGSAALAGEPVASDCVALDPTQGGTPRVLGSPGSVSINVIAGEVISVSGVNPSYSFTPPGGAPSAHVASQTFAIASAGVATVSNDPSQNDLTVTCSVGGGQTADAVGSLANNRGVASINSLPNFANRIGDPGSGGGPTAVLNGIGDSNGGVIAFDAAIASFDALEGGLGFGMWAKGAYTYFDDRTGGQELDGGFGMLQGGVDYRLSARGVVGIMAQGDIFDDDETAGVASASGVGFLVGPYAAVEVAPNTFLEAAALGGRAYNTARAATGAKADYESDRLLLTARASGDYVHDRLVFRPGLRFTYYAERSEDFVDGGGAFIEGHTETLGQVMLGPEVGYDLLADERVLRPFAGVHGLYSFSEGRRTSTNGVVAGADGLSAMIRGGVESEIGATRLRGEVSYSGLGGDDFRALSGSLSARIPLN